jgi:hypothetical protein
VRPHPLTPRAAPLPLVLLAGAGIIYLRPITLRGNDLALILILAAASRFSQRPTGPGSCRPGVRLTIASTPAGSNAGKHAAKRGAGDEADPPARSIGKVLPPRRLGAGGEEALWPVRINNLV